MKQVIGIVLIAAGLVWLLENAGILEFSLWSFLWRLWPVLLVYWGGKGFIQAVRQSQAANVALVNGVVMVLGLALLASTFGLWDIGLGQIFRFVLPVLIILLGLSLLRTTRELKGATHWAVLGGLNLGKQPFKLGHCSFIALMGGGELDLRQAEIVEPQVDLLVLCIMGGWDIKVPGEIRMEVKGESVLGGIEVFGDSSGGIVSSIRVNADEGDGPLIRMRAQSLLGGIEVKRV